MTIPVAFNSPSYLCLLPLMVIVIYLYYSSNKEIKKNIYYTRLIIILFLILALSQPAVSLLTRKQSVFFVVDRSASISNENLNQQKEFVHQAVKNKRPDDRAGVIAFGTSPMIERQLNYTNDFYEFNTLIDTNFTNIEKAVNLAFSNMKGEGNKRIVLLTDGYENVGDSSKLINNFSEHYIAVDVYPLQNEIEREIFIDNILLPERVNINNYYKIKVVINSNISGDGILSIYHNEKKVIERGVQLNEGNNIFCYKMKATKPGFHKYRVEIESQKDTYRENNVGYGFTIAEGKNRVLFLGEQKYIIGRLIKALEKHEIFVDYEEGPQHFSFDLVELQKYSAVILSDVSANNFNLGQMQNIGSYVRDTRGGLLTIGGENSFGAGNYYDTPLDEFLPVKSRVKSRIFFPTITLMITIDKSDSMNEIQSGTGNMTKLDIAKEATVGMLDLLHREEKVGIVAFDSKSHVVLPIQTAGEKMKMYEHLASLETSGGTSIYKGLERSYSLLQEDESAIKHIILLSDGKTTMGDFKSLTNSLNEGNITLSTIAIGEDVDQELMEKLAKWGGGRYYYTENASDLPQIFSSEAKRIISNPIVDKNVIPKAGEGYNEIITLKEKNIPPLKGFVATTPHSFTDVLLYDEEDNYPLLAGWRYGLGKTAVFTGDLGQKFASNWLEWNNYERFWIDLIKWVMRSEEDYNIFPHITREGDNVILTVDAVTNSRDYMNYLEMEAVINYPGNDTQRINLFQTGPGLYRGKFNLKEPGTYMVTLNWNNNRGEEGSKITGYTLSYSPEYKFLTNNRIEINKFVSQTGGRIINSAREVFNYRPYSLTEKKEIWYLLVWLAMILFLLEICLRVVNFSLLKKLFSSVINCIKVTISDIKDEIL